MNAVEGGWSSWSAWSPLCPDCGFAITERHRTCTDPEPMYGGANCTGSSRQSVNCTFVPCPGNDIVKLLINTDLLSMSSVNCTFQESDIPCRLRSSLQ